MNEFRKSYEYEEDKIEGLLLVFFIMLITAEIIIGVIVLVQSQSVVRDIPILNMVILVLCIIYLISILFTAISIFKIQKYFIKIAKVFLIGRLIFLTICISIIFSSMLRLRMEMGGGSGIEYESVSDVVTRGIIIPLLYTLIFSISWYVYFSKSKKCKEITQQASNL